MTQRNTLTMQPVDTALLGKLMLLGASIALVPITLFLIGAGHGDPSWSKFWMLRPLTVVPLAGAMAGLFYYFMNRFRQQFGWNKIVINIVCALAFVIALWLGSVLGLAGYYWH